MFPLPVVALEAVCTDEVFSTAWCGATISQSEEQGLNFLDLSCWDTVHTADTCCSQSQRAADQHGCWGDATGLGAASLLTWENCCTSFLVWRPPPDPDAQWAYDVTLRQILDGSSEHPGMVFGRTAAELNYTRCVEVGVLSGVWSEWFLASATNVDGRLQAQAMGEVEEFALVDLWANRGTANYRDDQATLPMAQELKKAVSRMSRFWPRVRFVQQASVTAARLFDSVSLDFVFLDARHDECAVLQDLEAWWPKVRPGGMLAGDDYLDAEAADEFYNEVNNNWSVCENGEVRPGAVRGAVDSFFESKGLQASYFRATRTSLSPQWLVVKS